MDDKHAVVRRILVALLCLLMIFSVMTSVIPSAMAEESEAGRSAPVTEEPKESVVDGIGDVSGVRYYNDTWREDLGTTALDGYTMWYYEMADGTVYASTNNPDAPDLVPDDTAFANDAALTEVITENVEAMNKIDGVDVDVEAAAASVYQRAANGISLMAVNWPYTEDTNTQIRYYGDYPVNSSLKTINGRMAYCLDPNLYSPNPEDMYAFDAGVWNDATLYSILAYGYGGAHPVLNQGDLYDQYYATIMALVRHIGNANYWEGLDYPYHAFDYYQPAKDLLAYAKAHNVNTAAYTLYYAKPNGQGVKPYQRLVALSGERYGTIRVTKTSTETGEAVPGTTFLIDESVRVTTTSDGSVSVGGVTVGNHTIREIAVPAGYQLS
ncbi:MAG: prealbumin-like fold domain-containing protein, partial [Eubacterium sp.]